MPPKGVSKLLTGEWQGDAFVQRSLVTLGLSVVLSMVCLWRLMVFITALLRADRRKSSRLSSSGSGHNSPVSRLCCGFRSRRALSATESSSLVGTPTLMESVLPQLLLRKCLFHIVVFMGVAAEVPIWSYFHAKALGGVDPLSISLPSGLYLLHLISSILLVFSLAYVLDLWLTVVEFEPHHLIRCWRMGSLLIFIPYIMLLVVVVVKGIGSVKAASALATDPTSHIYGLYTACALTFLCVLFTAAGTMIQSRIVAVFGGGHRFTWSRLGALLRVSLVMLVCVGGFLLRALDQVYPPQLPTVDPSSGAPVYLSVLVGCSPSMGPWLLSPCFIRWFVEQLPVLSLLYNMRITHDLGSDEGSRAHSWRMDEGSGDHSRSRSSSEEDGLVGDSMQHPSKRYHSTGSTAWGSGYHQTLSV